jgi:hypothetical protein
VKDYRTNEVLHRCDITGKLYPIFPVSSSSSTLALCANTITKDTWHRRLGHPGISSSFSKQFPCNNLCETCQLGNHLSLPFFFNLSRRSAGFINMRRKKLYRKQDGGDPPEVQGLLSSYKVPRTGQHPTISLIRNEMD